MDETTLYPLNIESQGVVYQDRNQKVFRILAQFDGFQKEYYVSDHGQRAALLVVRNGEMLLARQYRFLVNALSYEIPGGGGKMDAYETPEVAASRECFEETGVRCLNLKPLICYQTSLDTTKNYTYVFHSDEIEEQVKDNPERRVWIPLERCMEMVFVQRIADSLSIYSNPRIPHIHSQPLTTLRKSDY